ncbi:right-handed parallel beta-helix repeat-containing protein [Nannocystis sp. SCPEA4]|uniref:right-handed parallel beta-helix repeat-containing protein n=1 Tax=Nannocystis sp. SCPEA4 TaxID=2996787 RepID=UPI0022718ECF
MTKIESCSYTIHSAGMYRISDDLSCEGHGIIIKASNVRLNGGHHRISGTTGTGISVKGPRTDVVINNVLVQGFDTGIRVEGASDVLVMNATVEDSGLDGIDVLGSVDVTLRNVTASGNGLNGLALFDSSGVLVRTGGGYDLNGADGIFVDEDSYDNVIHAVFARGNGNDGIEVDGDDNLLQANAAEENGAIGIRLAAGATDNVLLANFALDNEKYDMADFNLPACRNTWKSARFETDNEGDGRKSGCIQ